MRQCEVTKQAAGIFLKASAYIREYGWQKEGMSSHGQPRCSMGALASAYLKQKWDSRLSRLMYKTLYEELAGMSLTHFNHKFASGEQVAQLYDRVAEKLIADKASLKY